eukprot:ctg_1327.g433
MTERGVPPEEPPSQPPAAETEPYVAATVDAGQTGQRPAEAVEVHHTVEEVARRAQETLEHATEGVRKGWDKLSTYWEHWYEEHRGDSASHPTDAAEGAAAATGEGGPASSLSWRDFSTFVASHAPVAESWLRGGSRPANGDAEATGALTSTASVTGSAALTAAERQVRDCIRGGSASELEQLFQQQFGGEVEALTGSDSASAVVDSFYVQLVQRYRCVYNDLTPERAVTICGRLFLTPTSLAFLSEPGGTGAWAPSTEDVGAATCPEPVQLLAALETVAKVQRGRDRHIRIVTASQQQYVLKVLGDASDFEAAIGILERTWRAAHLPSTTSSSTAVDNKPT